MQNDRTEPAGQPNADKNKPVHKGDVKHVVDTGLPPGINSDKAKDPGSNAKDTGPADNRS